MPQYGRTTTKLGIGVTVGTMGCVGMGTTVLPTTTATQAAGVIIIRTAAMAGHVTSATPGSANLQDDVARITATAQMIGTAISDTICVTRDRDSASITISVAMDIRA